MHPIRRDRAGALPSPMIDAQSRSPAYVAQHQGREAAARLLIGLPLRSIGRAASLLWMHFGEVRTVTTLTGGDKEVGELALHTEAAWRLLGPAELVTGKSDAFYDRDEPPDLDEELWRKAGVTRCDRRLEEFRALLAGGAMVVEAVTVDRGGALYLELSGAHRFEIVPTTSADEEEWRLFRPYTAEPHLVATSRGIEPLDVDDVEDDVAPLEDDADA